METALQVLAIFILIDLVLAVCLVAAVAVLRRRQAPDQRMPLPSLIGALIFLAVVSALIYGGVWMCLRSTS